jgi:hypothetical protein
MINYSCSIVCDTAVRGLASTLLINKLNSLTADTVDILHRCIFYQVLLSKVIISSVNASLNGHVQTYKTVPIDFQIHSAQWMVSMEHIKRTSSSTIQWGDTHLPQSHTCTAFSNE